MNYYEHHIGDYAEATGHLTFVEDAAYSRLIRKYYATEKPLPGDLKQVQRLVGARTKEEKEAVKTVLEEFFSLEDDGWHQSRCDDDIKNFLSGEPERVAKKTNEEARQKRHREERAHLFSLLNEAGEHAPWNTSINELRSLVERTCNAPPATPATETNNAPATAPATPATATQTPDTNTHTPITPSSLRSEGGAATSPPPPPKPSRKREEVTLTAYLALCKASGVKPVPDDHHIRRWCEDTGISAEMLQVAWVLFRERYTEGEKGKGKRYKDWPGHFATAVKENWAKLWFMGDDGKQSWTSTGLTHKAALDARLAQREAAHG